MRSFRTLDDISVSGKRVLVRVDLNVPFSEGKVSDTSRIESIAPTLLELANKGARVIALSHFGRPKGRVTPAMSLKPVVPHLSTALGGCEIAFGADCIGAEARRVVDSLNAGDLALLENTRFHVGEE